MKGKEEVSWRRWRACRLTPCKRREGGREEARAEASDCLNQASRVPEQRSLVGRIPFGVRMALF